MLIVANWKASVEDLARARKLVAVSKRLLRTTESTLVLAPPAPLLGALAARKKSALAFAAQDISSSTGGAITAPATTTTTVSREELKYKDRLVPCGGTGQPKCDFNQLMIMINIIIDFIIFKLAFPIFAIAFAYAGFLLLFFGSEDAKRSEAKKIAINAFFGFVIALVAWLVVKSILVGLGIKEGFSLLEGLK